MKAPSLFAVVLAALLPNILPNVASALTDGPRYSSRELDCVGNSVCNQGIGAEDGVCDVTGGGATYLRFDLFFFEVPVNATSIDGVTVEVKAASPGCAVHAQLAIFNPVGEIKTLPAPLPTDCGTSTYQTLGGPTDTWGLTLTHADVTDFQFGVVISTDGCPLAQVDAARLTVHYRTASAECGNGYLDPLEVCDDGNLTRGDGCSPSCRFESLLDKNEQKCVNAMNKAGAKLTQSAGKAVDKCIKAFVQKGANFADCDAAYRGGTLAATTGKIAASAAKLCDPAPPFGFVDPSTTSGNAVDAMDGVTTLVLGAGPSLATTQPEAACQAAVLTATHKLLATRASLFNLCKKNGLAGKNTTQIVSGNDLGACLSALPDVAGRVDTAEQAIVRAMQTRCDDVSSLAATFAAPCGALGTFQDIGACLSDAVESLWCTHTAAADGIAAEVTCP